MQLTGAIKNEHHLETGLTSKLAADSIDGSVIGENVDTLQVVSLAGCKIVGIVRRGDLHCPCPKVHVHQLCIADDGQQPSIQGMLHVFAMEALVPACDNRTSYWHPEMLCIPVFLVLAAAKQCNGQPLGMQLPAATFVNAGLQG